MRWSRYFLPTLREDPKDAEAISHKLMVRAGMIRRLGSGAYTYLPFGLRALQHAAAIVREEMNRAGAQELLMPALQPTELWKATGRYSLLGEVLIRFKDRTGKEMALGPTHEEVVTDLLKEIRSHKQLPVIVYQIQTKFRDEPRPRGGIIRSKEFLMKDAYSFDVDVAGLARSYQAMYEAYQRIFRRCGVRVVACEADPGMMGGEVSHEFMAPSESGEDRIVQCSACGYAANLEAAKCQQSAISATSIRPRGGSAPGGSNQQSAEQPKPLEVVKTPGQHTVEQVSRFLKVPSSQLIKTLLYDVGQEHVAVLVRGDHDVNEAKLARHLSVPHVRLSNAQTIERLSGAPVGFAGPVKLSGVRLLADHAVLGMVNGVAGANQAEAHLIHVNPGRDFHPDAVADLRVITEPDPCPMCGKPIRFITAIEAGHVFKLGTKYTQALKAEVQDASGTVAPMIMGCYGIGINRIVAAAIEQRHDANGIIWPRALAPFHVIISVMETGNAEHLGVASELHDTLEAAGLEVLLDDRDQSPGAKLKDADLIGVPVQAVIGKVWQTEQKVEVSLRATKERVRVAKDDIISAVNTFLERTDKDEPKT